VQCFAIVIYAETVCLSIHPYVH